MTDSIILDAENALIMEKAIERTQKSTHIVIVHKTVSLGGGKIEYKFSDSYAKPMFDLGYYFNEIKNEK